MSGSGMPLLQTVAERVVGRWLSDHGYSDVRATSGRASYGGRAVDLAASFQGTAVRIKLKPDPYFGTDPRVIADHSRTFYRADAASYAFEAVANSATRQPGWVFESTADELFYYYVALCQAEEDVAALVGEPDEVFFRELEVERDELVILPMDRTRTWFEGAYEQYTPRPVMVGGTSAWYRLVPRQDLEDAVSGIRRVGPVFSGIRL